MILLILIIAFHIFVLSKLVFLPYPELFVYPYLTNHGLLPYRDILDQHFPGLMFLPINLGNLGMTTPEAARIWQYGIVAIVQVLIFLIGRKIFKSDLKALVANLLFLIWQPFFEGWVLWVDSILPIFLLPAFYFGLNAYEKGKKRDLILTGLFLGASLIFKQVVGPLILFVLLLFYLRRKDLKYVFWFLVGLTPLPLVVFLYFASKGILSDVWYWTIVFNLTTFAKYGRRGPSIREFVEFTAVYGFSLLAFFNRKNFSLILWVTIFLFGSIFSANARFDFVHFQPSLPFVCLLSVIAFDFLWRKFKFGILIYFGIAIVFLYGFYRTGIGTKVYFFEKQDYQVAQRIRQSVRPGEKIFLFGTPLHYYQMSDTLPAGNVFVFQFPWFMMVSEDRQLTALKKDTPNLIVADFTDTTDGRPIADFAPKINSFILQNYEIYDRIGSTEFLRLKKQYAYLNRH